VKNSTFWKITKNHRSQITTYRIKKTVRWSQPADQNVSSSKINKIFKLFFSNRFFSIFRKGEMRPCYRKLLTCRHTSTVPLRRAPTTGFAAAVVSKHKLAWALPSYLCKFSCCEGKWKCGMETILAIWKRHAPNPTPLSHGVSFDTLHHLSHVRWRKQMMTRYRYPICFATFDWNFEF